MRDNKKLELRGENLNMEQQTERNFHHGEKPNKSGPGEFNEENAMNHDSENHDENSEQKESAGTEKTEAKNSTSAKEEVDYKSKYFYLAAEIENMRRRFEREKESTLKYGTEKVLGSLVEVLDNFDRTVDAIKGDDDIKIKNLRIGIDMVRNQFLSVLEGNGLKPVVSVGKPFDPNFHEALAQEESEQQEGTVVKEFEKAYTLNGRLLRAAKVIVAKGKTNN